MVVGSPGRREVTAAIPFSPLSSLTLHLLFPYHHPTFVFRFPPQFFRQDRCVGQDPPPYNCGFPTVFDPRPSPALPKAFCCRRVNGFVFSTGAPDPGDGARFLEPLRKPFLRIVPLPPFRLTFCMPPLYPLPLFCHRRRLPFCSPLSIARASWVHPLLRRHISAIQPDGHFVAAILIPTPRTPFM